jgi:2-methylcitrate dehydratase PrpD
VPYCVAYALLHGPVGLEAFTDEKARDPRSASSPRRWDTESIPANPYPDEYTGHVRVTMSDGRVVEERNRTCAAGTTSRSPRAEIEEKFRANCAYGGWSAERAAQWLRFARGAVRRRRHRHDTFPGITMSDRDSRSAWRW